MHARANEWRIVHLKINYLILMDMNMKEYLDE